MNGFRPLPFVPNHTVEDQRPDGWTPAKSAAAASIGPHPGYHHHWAPGTLALHQKKLLETH